ncbi:MAG TPA: hypothetical protein VLL97_12185 [Acidobacteriota bacterium]|nr:hypothetical protein [Acidobacteriota bacterium]
MRKNAMKFAVIAALLLVSACRQPDSADVVSPGPCDRACLENYVDRYMDAMLANVVSPELFAEGCVFTENGVRLPLGNEGLWASMTGRGTYSFYVPDVETQQVAFIGTAREEAQQLGEGDPVAVALRLKIVNGKITEAEQLVVRADSGMGAGRQPAAVLIEKMGSPHEIFMETIPPEQRHTRMELIEIANKYFTGLQKNDGKGDYPFTDDCDRFENGMQTTNVPLAPGQEMPNPLEVETYSTHWGCREQFESGLAYFVSLIRDRRFVAVDRERGNVFVFVFFDHGAGETRRFTTPDGREVVAGPTAPWTWQIGEIFRIENGMIRRIEAILHRVPYGMNSGWSTYEMGRSDEIQVVK